jgi:hypothetical protein
MRWEERKRWEWAEWTEWTGWTKWGGVRSPICTLRTRSRRPLSPLRLLGPLSPLPSRNLFAGSLSDNLPYGFQRHWVLERAQVSGFPAFGGGQDRSTEDLA